MALNSAAVAVGVTGSVYVAPVGTTVPTSTSAGLAAGFVDVGYISEDGVTEGNANDTNDIVAWQNGDIVRRVQTSYDFTVAFTMIETNEASLALFYGNFTHGPGVTDGIVQVTGVQSGRIAVVINVIDGTRLIRTVLPSAQITERGDVSHVNGDAISYPVTITAYPDANGVKAYKYIASDAAS